MKLNKFFSLLMMAVITVLSLSLTSCGSDDDDDTPAPVVKLTEANLEGDEVCTMADIVAKGYTKTIVIQIFDAAETTVKASVLITSGEYINKLNVPGFHVHVPVAGTTVAEDDLLKLTVTDANGRSTTAQQKITAEEEDED